MAAELQENFKANVQVVEGGRGQFDVMIDGKLIYSKSQTGKFPDDDEVTRLADESRLG